MNLINLDDAIKKGEKLPIKEWSPEQRGMLIHKLQTEMSATVKGIHSGYLHLGMYWNFAMKNKMDKWWGPHIKNANELIKELNLGLSRSLLDHYGRIWQTFGGYLERANFSPPVSRLISAHAIVMKIKDADEREAAIEDYCISANSLPHEAYQNKIAEAQGKIATDSCSHAECEIWSRCKICSKFYKVA